MNKKIQINFFSAVEQFSKLQTTNEMAINNNVKQKIKQKHILAF